MVTHNLTTHKILKYFSSRNTYLYYKLKHPETNIRRTFKNFFLGENRARDLLCLGGVSHTVSQSSNILPTLDLPTYINSLGLPRKTQLLACNPGLKYLRTVFCSAVFKIRVKNTCKRMPVIFSVLANLLPLNFYLGRYVLLFIYIEFLCQI